MFEEKESNEMKSLEAALSALTPRNDRLDRDRLMFLAGQQSILPSTFGREVRGEGDSILSPRPLACLELVESGEGQGEDAVVLQQCFNGNTFWKAAFAAMTALSAALLLMVLQKPEDKLISRTVEKPVTRPVIKTDTVEKFYLTDLDRWYMTNNLFFNLAFLTGNVGRNSSDAETTKSYPALLRQILVYGVDSWKSDTGGTVNTKTTITKPQTSRELLREYLDKPGMTAG